MNIIFHSTCRTHISYFILIVILLSMGIIRYGLIDVPLERDEGEYAYTGQLILQGVAPYKESYNMKFPGIYAAYALILSIFGQSHQSIHVGLLITNLITIISIFVLAKYLSGHFCAVTAAAVFALLSVNQSVQGIFANAEHFVILFAVPGLIATLYGLDKRSLPILFCAGILLSLGSVMKQHGIAFIVLAALYIILFSFEDPSTQLSVTILRFLIFISGTIAVFGLLCFIMLWSGVFKQFWFWTFTYASTYISQLSLNSALWNFQNTFCEILLSDCMVWFLAGCGMLLLKISIIPVKKKKFLLMYAVFSFLSISPGFYFRPHYFILILPCTALFAGVCADIISDMISKFLSDKLSYAISIALIALCCLSSIYKNRDFLFYMTPFQVSRSTYGLNPFYESLAIAKFIRQHTKQDDRICILGSEPQIFFYADRRSASPYIYMYPLMEKHDYALQMQQDLIKKVESVKPRLFIVVRVSTSWLRGPDSHTDILHWLNGYIKKSGLRLVGSVELLPEKSLYYWNKDVRWPLNTPCWVAIFERI